MPSSPISFPALPRLVDITCALVVLFLLSSLTAHRAGADFNSTGEYQVSAADPEGIAPTSNVFDRSFKESSMAATWNGNSVSHT
jgi:hypothetical protein